MALLAHWKIGDKPGTEMNGLTAVDSAAGGSGSHDGIYKLSTTYDSLLLPYGTDEYLSLSCSNSNYGYIHTFSNLSDLQSLHGEMSIGVWIMKRDSTEWEDDLYITNCGNTGGTSADNYSFFVSAESSRRLRFLWHYGSKTLVSVYSVDNILPVRTRPVHVGFVRYEITSGFYGIKFYVDGVLADTQSNGGAGWAGPTDGSSGLMYIGHDSSGYPGNRFHIDSVRIYDSADDTAISSIFSAESSYWEPAANNLAPSLTLESRGDTIYKGYFTGKRSGRSNAGFFEGSLV